MGVPIVRGPTADLYELCHLCVMIHKADAFKDQRLVEQVNAAIEKESTKVTYIQVTIRDHWQPEPAITTGTSIRGTYGPVCYNHIASHDEEIYQQRLKEAQEAQRAMKFGVDPATIKHKPKLETG